MPELKWSAKAKGDLERLYDFLAPKSARAASRTIQALINAPARLLEHPRIGEKPEEFGPREVRRILLQDCEIRYQVTGRPLYVLRAWHSREDR